MSVSIMKVAVGDFEEYLRDESRKTGHADSISFPAGEEEVARTLAELWEKGVSVTVQGARTGLAAGAVPFGGHILNLTGMNAVTGLRRDDQGFLLTVQPGLLLTELRKQLRTLHFDTAGWSEESLAALERLREEGEHFFPPDPTEITASIGGMAACNASGARSYHYGATRRYVEGLRAVLADGSRLSLRRGEQRAKKGAFSLTADNGRVIAGKLPDYRMPKVKNASGYYVERDMDLIDLFIGSEGTLGVVTELTLRLVKTPAQTWGAMYFFADEPSALHFVRLLRGEDGRRYPVQREITPIAIELFGDSTLSLLRSLAGSGGFEDLPTLFDRWHTAVYVELERESEEEIIGDLLETARRASLCGGSDSDCWAAPNAQWMEQLKHFRHAVPEAVNARIDQRRRTSPGITKLGTDMAVPDRHLCEVMELYRRDLERNGLDFVIFGHVGNNHLHVNIIPRSQEEYDLGRELYGKWAAFVLERGGTVSAEHGIGKLKNGFLLKMYGENGIRAMGELRRVFDPEGRINPGNLFT